MFIYYFRNLPEDNMWVIKTSELKSLIKDNISEMRVVMGGDSNTTQIVLIPKHKFKSSFYIDEVKIQEEERKEEYQR